VVNLSDIKHGSFFVVNCHIAKLCSSTISK
jgi:hypothetical protein